MNFTPITRCLLGAAVAFGLLLPGAIGLSFSRPLVLSNQWFHCYVGGISDSAELPAGVQIDESAALISFRTGQVGYVAGIVRADFCSREAW
jgi:hypothetical protein